MLSVFPRSWPRLGPALLQAHSLARRAKSSQEAKSALIILAPGAEEMEFTISADVLRRAKVTGIRTYNNYYILFIYFIILINVTVAGLSDCEPVKCSRGVVIVPDTSLEQAVAQGSYDAVVLPGGLAGNKALMNSKAVGDVLRCQESQGGLIAAICAAPTTLGKHGIALGKSLTSHPDMKPQLEDKYCYVDDKIVVQDGNIITSRGPGTTFDFALKITEQLAGIEVAQKVAKEMLFTFKS
ncbi:hypothetical protein KR059_001786 [Drosophila kikkawai]|nr:hypothetical protein KR059_001786 [Drosophila kikkawai]